MDEVRKLAKRIAAAVIDADLKMDEPEVYRSGYVHVDLMARLVDAIAPYTNENLERYQDHRLAYPEMLAADEAGLVRPFIADHVALHDQQYLDAISRETTERIVEVLRNRSV